MSTTGAAPLQPLPDRLAAFSATHKFYGWKDVRADVFAGDSDAFIDAWASGVLPAAIAHACEDTLDPLWLQVFLLRRLSRQMSTLIAALG
jgi:hypothetical protein